MNGNGVTQAIGGGVDTFGDRAGRADGARAAAAGGAIAWAGVAVLGAWDAAREGTGGNADGTPYVVFAIVLAVAAAFTFAGAWTCTFGTQNPLLRRLGLGAGAIAVASTVVAWAGLLWMSTCAVSFTVLAIAAPATARRGLLWVAVAQMIGIVVTVVGVELELGPAGDNGDYSSVQSLAVSLAAAGSAVGAALIFRGRFAASEQPA